MFVDKPAVAWKHNQLNKLFHTIYFSIIVIYNSEMLEDWTNNSIQFNFLSSFILSFPLQGKYAMLSRLIKFLIQIINEIQM